MNAGYVGRIERRLVGGGRGGSGQYVYQLGPHGHRLVAGEGKYSPTRAVNPHTLAIGDAHCALVELQRAGSINLVGWATEANGDCHFTIGRYECKPDYYAEIARPDGSNPLKLCFEIDMGTQGQKQITGKLQRYIGAQARAEAHEWPVEQLVMFLAIDEHRAEELKWLIGKVRPKEDQVLFRVWTLDELKQRLA